MNRRRVLSLLFCSSLAFVPAGCAPSRDNVVLVVIDTLRRDHLETYGYARQTAPFLDRLAREGVAFDGLAPSSWTKPSTASLLTGLHPLHHQALDYFDALPDGVETLAERLRGQGYHTVGVSSNGWISAPFGFAQGFETLIGLQGIWEGTEVNRKVFPLLETLEGPFFLYVHYTDPHTPYAPRTAWDGGELPAVLREQGPIDVETLSQADLEKLPSGFLERARDLYDGDIRDADRALEQLVADLDRRGLMEGTILVVTSDHGEEFGEHGMTGHGTSLYNEVLEVPMVFHAPHRMPAGRRGGVASLLDVMPTLEELLGLKREDHPLDGISLAGRLRTWLAESPAERSFLFHLDSMAGVGLALSHGGDKIVLGRQPYRKELYDVRTDLKEQRNRLGSGREEELAGERLARLADEVAGRYNDYSRHAFPRQLSRIHQPMREQLVALGYLSARSDEDSRRIPRRIVPADRAVRGLLGWEGGESLPSCLDLSTRESERQLLDGWYAQEKEGRWSEPRSSLVLGTPSGQGGVMLVLQGVSHRPDTPRVDVSLAGQLVLATRVPPGPFRMTAEVGRPSRGRAVVGIATDSPFLPARHGSEDSRALGLFLTSACLQAAGGKMAPGSTVGNAKESASRPR